MLNIVLDIRRVLKQGTSDLVPTEQPALDLVGLSSGVLILELNIGNRRLLGNLSFLASSIL